MSGPYNLQDEIPVSILKDRNALTWSNEQGDFWKPCPGTTKGYLCCGYQIITPLTGCGMYCRYCVLQAYLENQGQVAYSNLDKLEQEIRAKMVDWQGVVRFGTGEFADSLYMEKSLHFSEKIATILSPYKNAIIEFKTKSVNVDGLFSLHHPEKVIIGFSMNTPAMISKHERGTALLEQRLAAAVQCIEKGFFVAFHFDPMIVYDGWESEYKDVVMKIFDTVKDPSRIAWWSMGGFRSPPALKDHLKEKNMHLPLFSGEMMAGEDGKYRYLRSVRIEMYSMMRREIEKHYPAVPLYLCMESPEVWEASGLQKRIPDGLSRYLDKSVERMLDI